MLGIGTLLSPLSPGWKPGIRLCIFLIPSYYRHSTAITILHKTAAEIVALSPGRRPCYTSSSHFHPPARSISLPLPVLADPAALGQQRAPPAVHRSSNAHRGHVTRCFCSKRSARREVRNHVVRYNFRVWPGCDDPPIFYGLGSFQPYRYRYADENESTDCKIHTCFYFRNSSVLFLLSL